MRDKKKVYAYPSRYGSHQSMIIYEDDDKIICEDEKGKYETKRSLCDTGLADPNRYWNRKYILIVKKIIPVQ